MSDLEGDSDGFAAGSDSSEDELLVVLNNIKVKNENYLEQTVGLYSDQEFFEHFRVSREIVENLQARFAQSNMFKRHFGQYGKLSAKDQVLIYLWYAGHETASFRDVADRFNVTISSLHRIIVKLTMFVSNLAPEFIKWPTDEEKRAIEHDFADTGFPGVIGAIDGSHVKIDKPEEDADSYLNRKGYHSIQMQVVCDSNKKICDVFIGYPGSVHDSRVFRNSPLYNSLQQKCGHNYLLGDSGYPLKRHLLTPFKDRGNLNPRQTNYNRKLAANRYKIEHCFGILKQKFRQLYHLKLRDIRLIVHFIRACCVLYNMTLYDDFVLDEENIIENEIPEQVDEEDEEDDDATRFRDGITMLLRM